MVFCIWGWVPSPANQDTSQSLPASPDLADGCPSWGVDASVCGTAPKPYHNQRTCLNGAWHGMGLTRIQQAFAVSHYTQNASIIFDMIANAQIYCYVILLGRMSTFSASIGSNTRFNKHKPRFQMCSGRSFHCVLEFICTRAVQVGVLFLYIYIYMAHVALHFWLKLQSVASHLELQTPQRRLSGQCWEQTWSNYDRIGQDAC